MSEWKETDIGQIPKKWKLGTVDDIKNPDKKSIISGPFGSNISAKYFVETGVPVIRGNNLSLSVSERFKDEGFVYITEEKAKELNTWATIEDIVFTAVGTIGQVGLITKGLKYSNYIISNKQLRLRVDTTKVLPIFAYYWFSSPFMVEQIIQRNTGSSVPLINLSVLKSLQIPIPPLEEQQAIASVFSSLDDKIDLLHRQNQTLEQMAETLFRQWFVEEADEGWESLILEDLCEIRNGYAFKSKDYKESGHVIVRTKDFDNGYVSITDPVFLDEDLTSNYDKFQLSRKELLLVMVGASLGKTVIVTGDILPALQNQNMWAFKAHNELHQYYLNYVAKELVRENLYIASGSARSFFQKGSFYKFPISLPPEELLLEANKHFQQCFKKIELNRSQIRTLTALRDTLLPKLMSGEVRVETN